MTPIKLKPQSEDRFYGFSETKAGLAFSIKQCLQRQRAGLDIGNMATGLYSVGTSELKQAFYNDIVDFEEEVFNANQNALKVREEFDREKRFADLKAKADEQEQALQTSQTVASTPISE